MFGLWLRKRKWCRLQVSRFQVCMCSWFVSRCDFEVLIFVFFCLNVSALHFHFCIFDHEILYHFLHAPSQAVIGLNDLHVHYSYLLQSIRFLCAVHLHCFHSLAFARKINKYMPKNGCASLIREGFQFTVTSSLISISSAFSLKARRPMTLSGIYTCSLPCLCLSIPLLHPPLSEISVASSLLVPRA
jgi:hypothetical protein